MGTVCAFCITAGVNNIKLNKVFGNYIMKKTEKKAILFAIAAAALYALNAPLSKVLLNYIPSVFMAGFLYLGAGIGMYLMLLMKRICGIETKEQPLTKKELPYTIGMVVLDIAAPIFLMSGLTMTSAANASLLNNFEIVATSLIALLVFHEPVKRRLWTAIAMITFASILLSFEGSESLQFSLGSLLVLAACVCWGFENNCTRMLSQKSPAEIVVIKGLFSGAGSIVIAMVMHEQCDLSLYILAAMILGFVAYGLSIFFYIYAQRYLGAARTSAFYAVSPFIAAGLSLLIFQEGGTLFFWIGLLFMIGGAYLAIEKEEVDKTE